MNEPSLDTTTFFSLGSAEGPEENIEEDAGDGARDGACVGACVEPAGACASDAPSASAHVMCPQRDGRPARRPRASTTGWLDEAVRPRLFTPPVGRSAAQAHSTAPDGAGQPLPHQVRARMERALGGDLSSARVHMGAASPVEDERAVAIAHVLTRLGVRQ